MWIEYQPNPTGRAVGDCAVRAISKALDVDWETAFSMLAGAGFRMGDMPNSNAVIAAVLRQNGFYRKAVQNTCPDCYTAADFCEDHPEGVFVLGFGTHIATVEDGDIFDAWDSSQEIPLYYWYIPERK